MKSKQTRFLLLSMASAATLFSLSACNEASKEASKTATTAASASNNAIAAKVNGEAISEQVLGLLLKQRQAQGQPDSAELRQATLDQLTVQYLIAQEATKKGLEKTPEVTDQLDIAKRAILANAFVQDYVKTNPVNDSTLQAEYDKVKEKMGGNELKARHILVDQEEDAKAIIATLKKTPQSFAALAKEKSKDPGSKDKGGDLGWFNPRQMVPEFAAAAAKLAKGKFTEEPVKSQFGFHIILVDDSRAIEMPPFDQLKPMLMQQVQQQNIKKMVDELKAKAKIEISAPPANAATSASASATPAPTEKPAQTTK